MSASLQEVLLSLLHHLYLSLQQWAITSFSFAFNTLTDCKVLPTILQFLSQRSHKGHEGNDFLSHHSATLTNSATSSVSVWSVCLCRHAAALRCFRSSSCCDDTVLLLRLVLSPWTQLGNIKSSHGKCLFLSPWTRIWISWHPNRKTPSFCLYKGSWKFPDILEKKMSQSVFKNVKRSWKRPDVSAGLKVNCQYLTVVTGWYLPAVCHMLCFYNFM